MPKKKGNETIFSSQEATQLIFMDSDSEGDEVDLGENYCEESDKESDWEPDQEDLDTQSEQEKRKTKTIGTIRHNRKMFPTDFLKDSDIPKGSAVFKHHENILVIKYRAAKNKSDGKPKVVHLLIQNNVLLKCKIS